MDRDFFVALDEMFSSINQWWAANSAIDEAKIGLSRHLPCRPDTIGRLFYVPKFSEAPRATMASPGSKFDSR